MKFNALIPELTVTDINQTKHFYMECLGFSMEYEREEDKFVFLSLEDNQMMFEQISNDGWNTGELSHPFGRGINFEMGVSNLDELYQRVQEVGICNIVK